MWSEWSEYGSAPTWPDFAPAAVWIERELVAAALCGYMYWYRCRSRAAAAAVGMVGGLRRKLRPIVLVVLLLFMEVGLVDIWVSPEFPCSP